MKGENKMSKLFKQGDLIRRITEEGDGEIVCVLVDMEYSSESVHVELEKIKGQERKYTYVDPSDYELVTDDQSIQESKPMEPNTTDKTMESIHEDISMMYVQAVQFLTNNLDGENIELEISGTTNRDEIDVAFKCRIGYEAWIVSSNMFKSAQVALDRYKENKGLKPLCIPLYREVK
tara:strand:+ start:1543 stop:2073 length:531 start_codon:yes stop_codon:yes gene_type:complete